MKEFKANGKLLLTSEYFVLDGAKALCLPSHFGQKMKVSSHEETSFLYWNAFLPNDELWFKACFDIHSFKVINTTDSTLSDFLVKILSEAIKLSSRSKLPNVDISTYLDFPKNWGLGTSSTLIYLLSQWLQINPYVLLKNTFGGSGYDIACASSSQPLFFYLTKDKNSMIEKIDFFPKYHSHLYFIYLNKKQDSREGIRHYREKKINFNLIEKITTISNEIVKTKTLHDFEELLKEHENLVSNHLNLPKVQDLYFKDYQDGVVKSLGAWGGDFILVTSQSNDFTYFEEKGYKTIIPYKDMVY